MNKQDIKRSISTLFPTEWHSATKFGVKQILIAVTLASVCGIGRICKKAGEVRNQLAVNADWMPTLAELCNIELDTSELDGKSLLNIIEDPNLKSSHINGFCWQTGKSWAAKKEDWKLLENPAIRGEDFLPKDSLFLVNLSDNPGEMNNLAEKYPEQVEELKSLYKSWKEKNQ